MGCCKHRILRNGNLHAIRKRRRLFFFFPLRRGEKTECFRSLGTDHLTLEGGRGVGDFEKNFLQALVIRKKLHAAQM